MDFRALSDDELVDLAQNKDQNARDYILEKYKPLVKNCAKNFYIFGGDIDDLIQEGMIGLFGAIYDYDSSKGNFLSFARTCINRSLYKAIDKANSSKNRLLNESLSIDDDADVSKEFSFMMSNIGSEGDYTNPEAIIIDEENTAHKIELIYNKLSKYEQEVFEYMVMGYDYRTIAKKLEVDDKSIDNAINRIKNKSKKVLKNEK